MNWQQGSPNNQMVDKWRYEIKFVADPSYYDAIQQWINNHNLCFYEVYPTRMINNVYFDNDYLDSFKQNIQDANQKAKIRFRWYGDLNKSPEQPSALELKVSENQLGWKHIEAVSLTKHLKEMTRDQLIQAIGAQLSKHFRFRFDLSDIPTLINSYKRYYYVSMDGRVRVTLDEQLKFYDVRRGEGFSLSYPAHIAKVLILEFKCAAKDIDHCRQAMDNIIIQRSRFSKYSFGMRRILGV